MAEAHVVGLFAAPGPHIPVTGRSESQVLQRDTTIIPIVALLWLVRSMKAASYCVQPTALRAAADANHRAAQQWQEGTECLAV